MRATLALGFAFVMLGTALHSAGVSYSEWEFWAAVAAGLVANESGVAEGRSRCSMR